MNEVFCKPFLIWIREYGFTVTEPFTAQIYATFYLVLDNANPDQASTIVHSWLRHGFLSWLNGVFLPTFDAELLHRSELLRALLLESGISFPLYNISLEDATTSLCFQKILQVPELTYHWVMSSDFWDGGCPKETAEAVLKILKDTREVEEYVNISNYRLDCSRSIIFNSDDRKWVRKKWNIGAWPLNDGIWRMKRAEILQRIRDVLGEDHDAVCNKSSERLECFAAS